MPQKFNDGIFKKTFKASFKFSLLATAYLPAARSANECVLVALDISFLGLVDFVSCNLHLFCFCGLAFVDGRISKQQTKSAGPSIEGPPSCEAPARSFIFNLRLRWNHIIALHFLYFYILDPLKGQSLISHVSCLRSCWTVYCTQKSDASP